jgi:diguanylate cyclase (GGDEF)-like protein
MVICNSLKEKVIIIAENDQQLVSEITSFLRGHGFARIEVAEDGRRIYEILRLYYREPERIGLLIVNEKLPNCQLKDMCMSLSSNDDSPGIPFIVLRANKKSENCVINEASDQYFTDLNHCFSLPLNYSEFLIVIGFQLTMNHERFLRKFQEERLVNELAERKVVDAKLKYLVVHDELTSLLNRQNFERHLRLILNQGANRQHNGALLFIDIDRFSLINELEGFDAGDKILVEIVTIIRKLVADNDLFARIGSDEFCLFLENRTVEEVKLFAEKVRQAVYENRFLLGDVCYSCSLSIGISELSSTITIHHPGELISRARQACKMAKENGRNLTWEYNEKDTKVQERNRDIFWVPLIRKALLEERFFLVFQPVVDIISGGICHYETLIRMDGLNDHAISPCEFIPVSERMGLIHNIDLWVVENAIDFLVERSSNNSDLSLAINLSSMAFQNDTLLPVIKEKIEQSQIDAKRIIFEITETAAVESFEQTREMIIKIRSLGCKFALDDFGAGFCSFNYLKTFPVDYVKIDGQFIRNLINDETDQVLVKSMVEISSKLGKKTIAEFVETPEMITKLREIGVDLGQGYIFGKPKKELLSGTSISIANLMNRPGNIEHID